MVKRGKSQEEWWWHLGKSSKRGSMLGKIDVKYDNRSRSQYTFGVARKTQAKNVV